MNPRKLRCVALAAYLAFAGLGVMALQPASQSDEMGTQQARVVFTLGTGSFSVAEVVDTPTASRPVIACIGGGGIALGVEYRADAPAASRSDEVGS